MANSFTQLYVQMVFAVKNRKALILPENVADAIRDIKSLSNRYTSRFAYDAGRDGGYALL